MIRTRGLWGAYSLLPHNIISHHCDLRKLEITGEEKDWLLQVDRVTRQTHGKATQWLVDKSVTLYYVVLINKGMKIRLQIDANFFERLTSILSRITFDMEKY